MMSPPPWCWVIDLPGYEESYVQAETLRNISRLVPVGSGLWVAHSRQKYAFLEVGTRMTIVRLHDGALLLISPINIDDDLRAQIDTLGPVRYVVSPNLFHHLHIRSALAAYPAAKLFLPKGLPAKRPDLESYEILENLPPEEWRGQLDQRYFDGFRIFELDGAKEPNEVVFFHRDARTLIVTDTALNLTANSSFAMRAYARIAGIYEKLSPLPQDKPMVSNRTAARRAVQTIVEWPFEKIVLAHGDLVLDNAKERYIKAYQWLLSPA
jgi:hypothetical protein